MDYCKKNNITQYYLSKDYKYLDRYFHFLDNYNDNTKNTLFIGINCNDDLNIIKNYKGKIYILWINYKKKDKIKVNRIIRKINNISSNYDINYISTNIESCRYLNMMGLKYDIIDDYFIDDNLTYIIITNKILYSIAEGLKTYLIKMNKECVILDNIYNDIECKNNIYIILCSSYYTKYNFIPPKRYIFYQLEQKESNFFTNEYFNIMNNSLAIWDYSCNNNFYINKIDNKKKIFYNPLPIINNNQLNNNQSDEQLNKTILFYGKLNQRRIKIINKLKEKYNILYYNNLYGDEKEKLIKSCNMILNLHYYDNANLETCRINEVLRYGKMVLSEISYDNKNMKLYKDNIIFFDVIKDDLSNINLLYEKIDYYLENPIDIDIDNIYNECFKIMEYNLNRINQNNEIYNKGSLIEYVKIINNKRWIIYNINILLEKNIDNLFNIDCYFYKIINNLNISKYEIYLHINRIGLNNGLLYHPKQIYNVYPNVKMIYKKNIIYINNIQINDWIKNNIYNKSYDWYNKNLIHLVDSKIINYKSELIIICFIGNLKIGKILIDKINKYYKKQKFILCLGFNNKIDYLDLKNDIKVDNYVIYKCNEMGNDIIPSIFIYNNIKDILKFDYIIKLHTKGDKIWFNDLTNFILDKSLNKLLEYKVDGCNCIGCNKYMIYNYENHNKILMNKYKNSINIKYKFIKGTIFLCHKQIFEIVNNFIEKNNYFQFVLNNMYDDNSINEMNSPIHFIERLFGMIKIYDTDNINLNISL